MEKKNISGLQKLECILLISFLALFSICLLYIFRVYDNNTLTSWQWTFDVIGIKKILPIFAAAVAFSFLISWRFPFENNPVPMLVFSATMVVLPLWRGPELLLDSGRYFLQAKALSQYGVRYFIQEWGHAITAWTDMPLVPFLYGLIFKFIGESRTAVQLYNTIIFILTVLITCRIGELLWNRETGFYAGFLLLGMPYLLTQVPLMLVDIHTMFFLVLAFYCFLQALQRGGFLRVFLAAVTLAAACITKYSIWPMLVLFPVCGYIFLRNTPEFEKFCLRTAAVILLAAFPVVLVLGYKQPVFLEQFATLLTYQRPALKLWHENFVSTFFFQTHPFVPLLCLYGGFRAYQAKDSRFFILLLYILLIFILQIRRIRYMLPLFPFIALMAAYGLATIKDAQVKRYAASVTVTLSLVVLFAGYLQFFKTTSMMNIKSAGEFINGLTADAVEVYTLPQQKSEGSTVIAIPQLDLYTRKKIISLQDWSPWKAGHMLPLSPLLATWNMNKPSFYLAENQFLPLVVISGSRIENSAYEQIRGSSPPDGVKHFTLESGVFRYKTFVSVFY